jgi:hypothetical protein
VVYDGRKNTYTLSIKRKRVILKPMIEKMKMKVDSGKTLLSLSQFIEEIKSELVVFSLMPRSISLEKENDDSLEKTHIVLVEFSNLMLDELPQVLPSIREIQHQINLMSGFILPNKATYKLNLK